MPLLRGGAGDKGPCPIAPPIFHPDRMAEGYFPSLSLM